jgi:hypothetical protein
MKNHQKIFFGMCLLFTFVLILPTTLAFTETEVLPQASGYAERTIFPSDHRGRIQFSFTANASVEVAITNSGGTVTLWTVTATNGSCDLDVDKDEIYRARFTYSPTYAISIQYTVIEQGGIPGFTQVYAMIILLTVVALIYLKKHKNLIE